MADQKTTAGDWPTSAAPLIEVLKFVASINRGGLGARPQSGEFISGCWEAKVRGLIRQDGRDRWLTDAGKEKLHHAE